MGHLGNRERTLGMVASQREPAASGDRVALHHHQAESQRVDMGWIATALPWQGRSWLGLCLTMATHCDHATNMSIASQHVSVVERLVGRHSPARCGVFGLALRPRTMATRQGHYKYVD